MTLGYQRLPTSWYILTNEEVQNRGSGESRSKVFISTLPLRIFMLSAFISCSNSLLSMAFACIIDSLGPYQRCIYHNHRAGRLETLSALSPHQTRAITFNPRNSYHLTFLIHTFTCASTWLAMSLHRVQSVESWERSPRGTSPAAVEHRKMSFSPVTDWIPPKVADREPVSAIEVPQAKRTCAWNSRA